MRTSQKAAREVDAWNKSVSVGDVVDYTEVKGLSIPARHKTRTPAEVLSGHTAVVWLEGKRGCVAVSHCTPVYKEGTYA